MMGPGKYDHATTLIRQGTQAQGVILIVFGGAHGDGFSAQLPPGLLLTVPAILRTVADEIERSAAGTGAN